jgi:hypothetical protein
VGDRERVGSEVLLLGRGIGIDWTEIANSSKHHHKRRSVRDELAVPCACFILVVRERWWSVACLLSDIGVPVDKSVGLSRCLRRVSLVLGQVLIVRSSILEGPSSLWLRRYQPTIWSLGVRRCD